MRKLKQLFTWGFFFLAIFSVSAQNVQLSGTVKDEAGTPLLGVFIMIKGTQRGATTDTDGKYTLNANVGDVLDFTFLGMKTVQKKVTANNFLEFAGTLLAFPKTFWPSRDFRGSSLLTSDSR